ncbi:hypothetical protein P3X46_010121 [Hevea brasiliensis]|uniref:Malectin-like domain-containing protein n=1 Tax=Hevea brasiliensis TaxID=3981 RepID=A0ABQ9MGQ1_HEVBR|nr:hypothetical protein P3X46_010121 [Hevea brasiliensis]
MENLVGIDCGSQTSQSKNGLMWQTDEGFIKTGENKWISPNIFKEQNKNCYSLPAPTIDRYFIRAMFHYGNYDGLSNPPTFDIQFDGNKWTTVTTSLTDTTFHEVVYTSKGNNISVCLARTQDNQFPFISMLKVWAMPDDAYDIMTKDKAWVKAYRYNYGGSDLILVRLNRIWKPMTHTDLNAVKANFTTLDYTVDNDPPDKAIIHAVEAPLSTNWLLLQPLTVTETIRLDYVSVYFTEIVLDINAIRTFDLCYQNCAGYMKNTQSFGSLTVDLFRSFDSTLPPIISAIEVYATSESLVTAGTSQNELDGLAVLINSFEQLKGWSGEPCLPSDTVWQWLENFTFKLFCRNLSGYGLNGPLPDLSQMQALETINLSDNSLSGPVPDFLGNLPSLRLLDLRDNGFSGEIPQSIADNNQLTYYIDGNPNLHRPKKKNLALIVGLAVGIQICLLVVIAVIFTVYFSKRKPPPSSQGQATEVEMGGTTQDENPSLTVITEAIFYITTKWTHTNLQMHADGHSAETGREDISANVNAGITNPPPVVQDIDKEELNDLLRQHGSTGVNVRT